MKSIDKYVLVLVASLALLLAGCGGGMSTPDPVDPGPTPEELAAERAQMQTAAIMTASDALRTALTSLSGTDPTQAQIDSLNTAISDLQAALSAATDVSDAQKAGYQAQVTIAQVTVRAQMQIAEITTASTAVNTALAALSGSEPTQAQIDAVNTAISDLQAALNAAVDVNDVLKVGYQAQVTTAQATVSQAQATLMAIQNADAEEAAAAMAAMTAKLWAGIGETPLGNHEATTVAETDGALSVQRNNEGGTDPAAVALELDEAVTVAALHGWTGSEHSEEVEGATGNDALNNGTYTARLYSNVGEPTEGAKFNSGAGDGNVGFDLTNGALTAGFDANPSRIASPQFDHGAGSKEFELPDPNPNGETMINISGSYYGVAGTYTCTPGTNNCTVIKATGKGYTLGGGGTWSFTPDNPEDRVTESPDTVYAVYGWWLHEAADGTATVSAFTGYRGTAEAASGITALAGTATYKGGAAGKYAISAGTTNDSGHFTADAELKANFNTDKISGAINNFIGGDGMSRDWSVALKESDISDTGAIAAGGGTVMTIWTMDGTDGADSGQWSGTLYENNDNGVPSAGTGTFHSEFSNIGRMVGAFGVNLED